MYLSLLRFGALFVTIACAAAHAVEPPPAPGIPVAEACRKIEALCLAAGFKPSWPHCMKPLMAGKKVKGVTVSPADIQACKSPKWRQ